MTTTAVNTPATFEEKIALATKILGNTQFLNEMGSARMKLQICRDEKNEGRPLRIYNADIKKITDSLNLDAESLYRIIECLEEKAIQIVQSHLEQIEKFPEMKKSRCQFEFEKELNQYGIKALTTNSIGISFREIKDTFKAVIFTQYDNHYYFFAKAFHLTEKIAFLSNACIQSYELEVERKKQAQIEAENKLKEKKIAEAQQPQDKNNSLNDIDARFA